MAATSISFAVGELIYAAESLNCNLVVVPKVFTPVNVCVPDKVTSPPPADETALST